MLEQQRCRTESAWWSKDASTLLGIVFVLHLVYSVDGFTSSSPSSAVNRSHGIEWFATVLVDLSVHTRQQTPRVSATRAQAVLTHIDKSRLKLHQSHYTLWRRLGRRGGISPIILDLGTRWGWVVSITLLPRFSPGERTHCTHCTGGWVGPRAGLDTEARGKSFAPLLGIEPRSPGNPALSQTLYWLSYPAHHINKSSKPGV
jgi:hypothetical protein